MSQSSASSATSKGELVRPERIQDGRKQYLYREAIRLQPLLTVSPEETGCENIGYWPQIAEVPIKGMISVSPDI